MKRLNQGLTIAMSWLKEFRVFSSNFRKSKHLLEAACENSPWNFALHLYFSHFLFLSYIILYQLYLFTSLTYLFISSSMNYLFHMEKYEEYVTDLMLQQNNKTGSIHNLSATLHYIWDYLKKWITMNKMPFLEIIWYLFINQIRQCFMTRLAEKGTYLLPNIL